MDKAIENFARLLREAEKAHKAVDITTVEWPEWYAEYLLTKHPALIETLALETA